MKIIMAEHAGFCFGVKRAVNAISEALKHNHEVWTIGLPIHNPQEVSRLEALGLRVADDESEIPSGAKVLIRAHGEPLSVIEKLKARNIDVEDMTCPFVKKAQDMAARLSRENYYVILLGDKNHPEIKGILGHIVCDNNSGNQDEDAKNYHAVSFSDNHSADVEHNIFTEATHDGNINFSQENYHVASSSDNHSADVEHNIFSGTTHDEDAKNYHVENISVKKAQGSRINSEVVANEEEAEKVSRHARIALISQTTQREERLSRVAGILTRKTSELHVCNTICKATAERQDAVRELVRDNNVDGVVLIGGRASANTAKLRDIIISEGVSVLWVEEEKEIMENVNWFSNKNKIGIAAGASTPEWLIDKVKINIAELQGSQGGIH